MQTHERMARCLHDIFFIERMRFSCTNKSYWIWVTANCTKLWKWYNGYALEINTLKPLSTNGLKVLFQILKWHLLVLYKKKNSVSWPLHAQNMSSNLTAVFRITCICYIFTSAGLILFAEFLLRLFVHPFWRSLALSEWLGVTRQWMYFIACIDN